MQYRFMADCTLPTAFTKEQELQLTDQRAVMEYYLDEGILVNYALSLEHAKLWAVWNATSEVEVLELMVSLPLSEVMDIQVSLLNAFDTKETTPEFSLN
jgi:hypothetical protein